MGFEPTRAFRPMGTRCLIRRPVEIANRAMTEAVIADASVLIHLSRIGRFRLLRHLFSTIYIPRGVYREVVEVGWSLPGSVETEEAVREGWIKVEDVRDRLEVRELIVRHGLHAANAEVLQLAVELGARELLADEAKIRDLAEGRGIKVRGCMGVLIEAARRGLLSVREAREALNELVRKGYRVSREVLRKAHEILSRLEG